MDKYTQTYQELRGHLCEQMDFLRASAASYDNGAEGEAKRLAITIRVLVHDTKKSKSLLLQLNMKHLLRMHDTNLRFNPRNLLPHQGLVVTRIEGQGDTSTEVTFTLIGKEEPYDQAAPGQARAKVTYVPRVSAGGGVITPITVSFEQWWEQEIIIRDKQGQTFSRRDLVLAMANKEGGAHVDPELDTQYAKLTRFNSQGWQVRTWEFRPPPDNSLVAANVRQIAHELLVSVEESFPGVCVDST